MKNYFKFYSLLIISLVLIGCNNAEQLNVFGYESRAIPIVEAMAAMVILDYYLINKTKTI